MSEDAQRTLAIEMNFKNRTMWSADNLDVMRGMNSQTVDLIYLDPPFNSKRDYAAPIGSQAAGAAFSDTWSLDDIKTEHAEELQASAPELWHTIVGAGFTAGDSMQAYLTYMSIRLIEMRRILKSIGSIYLHCDPTASHYLKQLMDAVFGRQNFRNEIVWYYKTGGMSKRWFGRKHDLILFFSKSRRYVFNPQKEKSYLSHKYGFSNVKIYEDPQGPYTMVGMRDVWDVPALRGNQPETTGYPALRVLGGSRGCGCPRLVGWGPPESGL